MISTTEEVEIVPAAPAGMAAIRIPTASGKTQLFITGFPSQVTSFAQHHFGFQANEPIESFELSAIVQKLDETKSFALGIAILDFLDSCYTRVRQELSSYRNRLSRDSRDFSRITKHADLSPLIGAVVEAGDAKSILDLLMWITKHGNVFRLYRGILYSEVVKAVEYASVNNISISEALSLTHGNSLSYEDRYGCTKLASRTVLSKGLEYDEVIVDVDSIKDPRDFYVAISRCKSKLYLVTSKARVSFRGVFKDETAGS